MRSILLIVAGTVLAAALGALVMLGASGRVGGPRARLLASGAAGHAAPARVSGSVAPGTLITDRVASKVNSAQPALTGAANPQKSEAPPVLAASEQAASGAQSAAAGNAAPAAGAPSTATGYVLQVAAFDSPAAAAQLQKALAGQGFNATLATAARGWSIVEVACAGDRLEAAALRARLQERSGLAAAIVRAGS